MNNSNLIFYINKEKTKGVDLNQVLSIYEPVFVFCFKDICRTLKSY